MIQKSSPAAQIEVYQLSPRSNYMGIGLPLSDYSVVDYDVE